MIAQRWRDRRDTFLCPGTTIRPADYAVDILERARAKAFVERHHYSGTFPADRLSVGLFRGLDLVGVAVFSVPMNQRAVPYYLGVDAGAGCELGRLVLLDDVPFNGESWFMARAFRALRSEKPDVQAVLSYSDPVERLGPDGRLVKPGHVGIIYQALNAAYRGMSGDRTAYVDQAGRPLSGRALSKIRRGERGWEYAIEQLRQMGAADRRPHEEPAAYLRRLEAEGFVQRRRRSGNHAYAFPLTRAARRASIALPVAPYPERIAA